ncbi:hypothetical protein AB8O52_00260 [Mycoplasmopsis arginini]|uniref:hypothetical protein n=1 Tax=Mycoplasmopsis arginini TaxID=2094 RepID=UPI0035185A1D
MNIIDNLANLFEMTSEEVEAKLNLKQNYEAKDIAKALGVYSLFTTKEEHGKYVAEKLANKEKQISDNAKVIEELNNKVVNSEKWTNNLKTLINNEWKKLGIKRSIEKENIDFNNLDFNNLSKSLMDYADSEGLAYSKPNYNSFVQNNENIIENEIDAISVGGAVKK